MKHEKEGNIIWLASYPKSGNTWLRIFLNNLLSDKDDPIDINELHKSSISSNRSIFDEMIGVDSADLTPAEIDDYLPHTYQMLSGKLKEKQFIKTHIAYTKNQVGQWLIPLAATYKVIYLIRNPLDVCVSFTHHSGHTDFDRMIKQLANSKLSLGRSRKRQKNKLHQFMGSWSDHVKSWIKNIPAEKLLVVRYEDMKNKPQSVFSQIVVFLGLDYSCTQIANALEKSKIENLQKMESEIGFKERKQGAKCFFRKGIIGSYREELTENQVRQVIECHHKVMIQFHYLSIEGKLLLISGRNRVLGYPSNFVRT